MYKFFLIFTLLVMWLSDLFCQERPSAWTDQYNVSWATPSSGSNGSMPTGNGDIGLNVWMEKSGELLILVGKTDFWDENASLVKAGRIRLRFQPSPFENDTSFSQVLNLRQSSINILAGKWLKIKLWVDANNPVIHLESEGSQTFQQEVMLESWRNNKREMPETQVSDLFKNLSGKDPYPTYIYPDKYFSQDDNRIFLFHENQCDSLNGFSVNMVLQGLGDIIRSTTNPLENRTFGIAATGSGFIQKDLTSLKSIKASRKHEVELFALSLQPADQRTWISKMNTIIENTRRIPLEIARKQHEKWWTEFWDRSILEITGISKTSGNEALMVARAYNLCRYMNACAGRGAYPIKFNGSVFSYGKPQDPDYRRWGGPGFWHQNQRLVYWPMLAQGDFDLMKPWFALYHQILPLARYRTHKYFNHDGAFFPETITPWGSDLSSHYGWTPYDKRKNPLDECTYLTFHFQSGIEQLLMMFDYFEYTGDTGFVKEILLPHADAVTTFYDQHYHLDNHGKIHIGPAQSLETWQVAVNPMPEIAGLRYVLPKLGSLPSSLLTSEEQSRWEKLESQLPPLPSKTQDGKQILLPAAFFDMKMNVENPELYAVFPYRIFGVGKKDLDVALNTYFRREYREDKCWYQNALDAALLGLADSARQMVVERAQPASYSESRFPAFWNMFNDWSPDIDHGGNLQLALNNMLLQCEGTEIRLLPAWPKDWNVHFKLHAPQQTTVECEYRNGKIESLHVTPESRKKDVILPL
jgi:hypothetical protein